MVAQVLKGGRQYGSVILRILAGSSVFMFRGITPAYAYQSMIRLFCLTGGYSNDILAKAFAGRPYQLPKASGVLGDLDEKKLAHVTATLRDRGYYIFENRLTPDLVARLVEFASTQKCTIRPSDADSKQGIGPR